MFGALLFHFFFTCVKVKSPLEGGSFPRFFEKATFLAAAAFCVYSILVFWGPLTHPGNIPGRLIMDIGYAFPYKCVWIESLKKLYPAFWMPYSSLGQPFLAMASPGAYSPFNFLYFFEPPAYAFTLSYCLHFFLGAFGTYLFIRTLGCQWLGACLGGFSFAFSGFFMGHLYAGHSSIVNAASWIPSILYGLRVFAARRQASGLIFGSAAMGCCILEGMPQINMYAMMLAGFFMGWSLVSEKLGWKRFLAGVVFFLALSISAGLCQLAPTYQFSRLSERWAWGTSDLMKEYFSLANFRLLVQPFFTGGPGTFAGTWGYHEIILYVGLVPLFLALTGLMSLFRKRPMVLWLGAVILLSTMLAMADATPFTHCVYTVFSRFLPGFSHNRSVNRISVLTTFALACLAGMAVDEWSRFWKAKAIPGFIKLLPAYLIPAALLAGTLQDLYRFDMRAYGTIFRG